MPPALEDCCGSGCNPCIFDVYEDALERYRQQLAAWQQRQQATAHPRSKGR
ncbi:MAG: oxidoreductase-like domain-containing protein [Burkholderiaceae bacterium]